MATESQTSTLEFFAASARSMKIAASAWFWVLQRSYDIGHSFIAQREFRGQGSCRRQNGHGHIFGQLLLSSRLILFFVPSGLHPRASLRASDLPMTGHRRIAKILPGQPPTRQSRLRQIVHVGAGSVLRFAPTFGVPALQRPRQTRWPAGCVYGASRKTRLCGNCEFLTIS